MHSKRIGIVGGGAAGFFAALACAEAESGAEIFILEKTSQFLSKVKISGGGRCNVTHACFDEREFAARFPRGERALIAPFKQFQASDTVAWFAAPWRETENRERWPDVSRDGFVTDHH